MSLFIDAIISDRRYLEPGTSYRCIDSTAEVNGVGLDNRLQYEHVVRLLTDSYRQFLNDYLPNGKEDAEFSFCNPKYNAPEKCNVYLWAGYIICLSVDSRESTHSALRGRDFSTGSDYFGQWVNVEEGVYGDNLLELFIHHSKNHPRDAHKILARKYGWDLSPDAVFLRNQKFGYRQSPTMPLDFDFKQHLKFIEEIGWTIVRAVKYLNKSGALRGALVYCKSPDKERMISIPVVQFERISDNGQEACHQGITRVPAETCYNTSLRYNLHVFPPRPVYRADISFFEAPYPLFNEVTLENNKDGIVIISNNEVAACSLISMFNKYNIVDYISITWPGGQSTVDNTDWWSLEDRKIGFYIDTIDKRHCRLAYQVYQAVHKVRPSEFNFHVPKESLPDSLEGSVSFASDYRSLTPEEFVKYVWEKFNIALEDWIKPAPKVYTVEEYLALDTGEQTYVLDPILSCPGTAEIFAPRGLGKTFFALELAKTIATGGTAFGRWASRTPRDVLYIDGEMSVPSMANRLRMMNLKEAGDKLRIMSAAALGHPINDVSTPEGQADVERCLKEYKPEVIFLDNLATLAPSALGNDAECCVPLNTWVQGLKCRGYTVVLIHHAGKGKGVQRGSSSKEDALDLVISLETPTHKRNHAHFDVFYSKGRDFYGEAMEAFSLTLTPVESEDGKPISAYWEVGEKSSSKVSEAKPKAPARPTKSPEEKQRLLTEIENLFQTTSDNEDIIAEKAGFKNRGCLNRFLDKFPDDKKRIKSARPSTRSANKGAAPPATIESEQVSTFPN